MRRGSRTGTSGAGAGPGRTPRHGRPVMGRGSVVLVASVALGVLLASAGIYALGWAPAFGQADQGEQMGELGCDGTYYRYSDERLTASLMYQFGNYLGLDQSFVDEHLLDVAGNEIEHVFQQQVGIGSEMDRLDRAMEELNSSIAELDSAMEVLDARIGGYDSPIRSLDVKMEVLGRAADGIKEEMGRYGEYDRTLGRYVIQQNFLDDPVDLRRAMALYGQLNDTARERVLLVDEQRRIGDEQWGVIEEKNGLIDEQNILVDEYNLLAAEHGMMAARYGCIGGMHVQDDRAGMQDDRTEIRDERTGMLIARVNTVGGHPGAGAHRIGYEDVPGFADGTIEMPALRQAIRMWEGPNAGLGFVVDNADPDVTIIWERIIPGGTAGVHGPVLDGDELVIRVEMGDYGCDGEYYLYSQDNLADTLAHELGHHLGLDHVITEEHLMYGTDGVGPGAFDSLGYEVPRRAEYDIFLLQEELDDMMDGIDRELGVLSASLEEVDGRYNRLLPEFEEMDAEYERLSRLYAGYPSVVDNDIAYRAAMELYDQMADMRDEYNSLADTLNELGAEYNGYLEEEGAMIEEYNLLAGRYNCISNVGQG